MTLRGIRYTFFQSISERLSTVLTDILHIDVSLPRILISQAKGIPTWRSTAAFLITLFHVFGMASIIPNHFIMSFPARPYFC